MPTAQAKKRLMIEWFSAGGFLFLILLVQSILGHYGDRWKEALNWFLSTVAPTLSLMIGVLSADFLGKARRPPEVERFPFWLTFWLSAVYLLVVMLFVFLSPFAPVPPLTLLKNSEEWLHMIQPLVGISIGWFFVSK